MVEFSDKSRQGSTRKLVGYENFGLFHSSVISLAFAFSCSLVNNFMPVSVNLTSWMPTITFNQFLATIWQLFNSRIWCFVIARVSLSLETMRLEGNCSKRVQIWYKWKLFFHIERFHSRGQQPCKFIRTKECFYIRKEFNSHGIGLVHQHGRQLVSL